MPKLPVTGDMLYDFVLVIMTVIVGVGLALKAEKWWGWVLVGGAAFWAFALMRAKGYV
jgi:hypothetical protein